MPKKVSVLFDADSRIVSDLEASRIKFVSAQVRIKYLRYLAMCEALTPELPAPELSALRSYCEGKMFELNDVRCLDADLQASAKTEAQRSLAASVAKMGLPERIALLQSLGY